MKYFLLILLLVGCSKIEQPIKVTAKSFQIADHEMTCEIQSSAPVVIKVSYYFDDVNKVIEMGTINGIATLFRYDKQINSKSYIIINWNDKRGKNELMVW